MTNTSCTTESLGQDEALYRNDIGKPVLRPDGRQEKPPTNSDATDLADLQPLDMQAGRASARRKSSKPDRERVREDSTDAYRSFQRICDEILEELCRIHDYLEDDAVSDEGLEVTVEVEHLVERLYDCPWGAGDELKKVVMAVKSQIGNARWTKQHVAFLKSFFPYLRTRYVINEQVVKDCYDEIKTHELNPFRGTLTEPEGTRRYRIVEVERS